MTNKTILIVDDTFENLYLLRVILEESGYSIIEANNGQEGLNILHENHQIDLIISDILMPIMDGYLFCQACKKEEALSEIPFVFYTSTYTEKLDEEFALKLGASNFLRKPIDHEEVLNTVNTIFNRTKKSTNTKKNKVIAEDEVLKLYSERLIKKLEQKSLDLGNEVLERKKAEQLLIQKNEILDLIAVNTPLNRIFDKLLLNYESIHPNYFGSISLLDNDGIHLNLSSAPSLPKAYCLAIKKIAIGKNVGSCGTAAFVKKPIIVSDISKDKLWINYKDLAAQYNLNSCWSLPIFSKNKEILGTFAIYSKSVNNPSIDDIQELNFAVKLAHIAIEKFRASEEIKKRDESYKALIDQANDSIITYTLDGTIHQFNKAAYTNLGYTKNEFLNLKIQDINIGDFIQNKQNHQNLLDGKSIVFPRKFTRKDGSIFEVEVSAKKQKDGKILAIARDITAWQNNLREIKKAREFSSGLLNAMNEGLVVINLESEIISVNPAFCKMTGFTEKELIGVKRPYPYSPPELKKENDNNYKLLIQNKNKREYENTYMRKNGERFPVYVSISSIYDENGVKTSNFSTVLDITERKQAEKKLLESEQNLKQSQKVANIASLSVDLKTMTWACSETLENIIGIDKSFIKTVDNWNVNIHPDDLESVNTHLENCINLQTKYNKEYRFIRVKDKKEIWIHGIGEVIIDKLKKPIKIIGTVQDITERKKAELTLKAAKEFTDKLIMSMQEGLLITDLNTKIIMVNKSLCNITGYALEELMQQEHPYPFWQQKDLNCILNKYNEIANEKTTEVSYDIVKKNGEKIKASFFTGTIKNDKDEVIALYTTVKDISKEEKAKQILIESAKKSNLKKKVILELANLVGEDLTSSLKKITKLAAKTLNIERVSVWKLDDDIGELVCERLYKLSKNSFETGIKIKYKDNPAYFEALYKNETILIEDAQNSNSTKKFTKNYLKPNNITSLMGVCINDSNGYYGVVSFGHVGMPLKKWTAEDQEFASSIASIVSLMIESSERQVAEDELKTQKEFSENLIASLNEGLSVVNLKGEHIRVNDALCKMTGFTEKELIGIKAPFPYWPPEEYDNIFKAFNNPIKSMGLNKETILMRKNGERFPVTLSDSVIKDKEGYIIAYFTTITDITYRVKAENILKENIKISNQRKNIIIKLANLIGEEFGSSLKKISTTAAKALNADLVTIWEYQNNKTQLLSKLFYNSINDTFDSEGLTIKKEKFPNYFNAFKTKNSINIDDVVNNPITKAFAKQFFIPNNVTSRIDVLIYGRNDYYGIISFESTTSKRIFTDEEESFATSIASIVSLMIESKERTLAESRIVKTNQLLIKANTELTELRNQLEQENVYLRNELDLVFNYEEMVYGSTEFSNVLSEVEKVAPTNATVLLLGESGTGKELIARALHNTSTRNNKPLIKVNCSAIPRELIESELFGHKKGSFTGAFRDKIGKFELADGGTLFLDEIGELPLDMQPKILRFLQEGEIEVVGGAHLKKLDVRVIAATNRDLLEEINKKQFREDLYFRLNVFPIEVPPLRKRKDDIPLLVEHFIDKFNKAYDKNIKYVTDDSMSQLKAHNWPGNVRELENLIERASILSDSDTLIIPGYESNLQQQKAKQAINEKDQSLDTIQRNHIINILEQSNWVISGANGASHILNLKPSTLRDKMKKLGIKKPNTK
ncbi:hypothetical protein GCM10022291_00840 [Postechiella marina]|uniref:PAS domain S-box protein n=1 Tax=Postechiella marina TaxID=943941 RepID=A0ABP8BYK4_9FLAO